MLLYSIHVVSFINAKYDIHCIYFTYCIHAIYMDCYIVFVVLMTLVLLIMFIAVLVLMAFVLMKYMCYVCYFSFPNNVYFLTTENRTFLKYYMGSYLVRLKEKLTLRLANKSVI